MTETSDPRVRVENYGPKNWRTLVRDDVSGWGITGPPYPTKAEALVNVDHVARYAYDVIS